METNSDLKTTPNPTLKINQKAQYIFQKQNMKILDNKDLLSYFLFYIWERSSITSSGYRGVGGLDQNDENDDAFRG